MTKHMPPVPPASRPRRGPKDSAGVPIDDHKGRIDSPGNAAEKGDQANIYQNTHNQGYQQDR